MAQPSGASDPLSDLQSFALLDRLVDWRLGGGKAHAGRILPDEEPKGEYPRPTRRTRGDARPARGAGRGRTGDRNPSAGEGEVERPG